jgi:hypothetical protein
MIDARSAYTLGFGIAAVLFSVITLSIMAITECYKKQLYKQFVKEKKLSDEFEDFKIKREYLISKYKIR